MLFKDRRDAGQKLAERLIQYKNKKDTIILGLPRGGVVVADEVASFLNLSLDLVVPRKIGAPGNPEYAIGAITEDDEGIFNMEVITTYGISSEYLKNEIEKEKREAERRLKIYRGKRPTLKTFKSKIVILIDDGIATGLTMKTAIRSVKKKGATKVIVAVPVAARDSLSEIKKEVDEIICLYSPEFFGAVGAFYEEFGQTEDGEVIEIMKKYEDKKSFPLKIRGEKGEL
jgi:putative phosphoribosyl transferase